MMMRGRIKVLATMDLANELPEHLLRHLKKKSAMTPSFMGRNAVDCAQAFCEHHLRFFAHASTLSNPVSISFQSDHRRLVQHDPLGFT